ncbi:MAG TPA: hydroxysqualene dehydroxylase HpnE [Tepidisphaeraceae bacterium]|nr:hydroxysqualene dehydroxylase HpnE [Tepidisphaeraceae bacterium]
MYSPLSPQSSVLSPKVLVVGGGLAGMAAAVALESAGISVTLIEARRTLGGRAGSFQDPQTGEILDNCQHVLLGCCTNLIDFYKRIDALSLIRFERTIHFLGPDGRRWDLTGTPGLPAPLHLGLAFARFGLLTLRQRRQVAEAMIAILSQPHPDIPLSQWLAEHGQDDELIRRLYDPIVISGLNEQTRISSAAYALKIFHDSLLINSRGFLFGLPTCPLGKLYGRLPLRDLRLGVRLGELIFEGRRFTAAKTQDGQTIPAGAVILATNYHSLAGWIPPDLAAADSRFSQLDRLENSPILGAHLWFDRPVLTTSHLALVDGPLQWLFRKDQQGAQVHGVISAARQWLSVPREEALKQFEAQVRSALPDVRGATLKRGVVVIEKRATFSPLPGVDAFRPSQAPPFGGIGNLFLAGDYTRTGWPATMEGAVRSGYLAADAVLRRLDSGCEHRTFLVDDLQAQWPARLLTGV